MFSTFKKTPRKGEEKKQRGKARMFTYRQSAFSRRTAETKPYAAVGAWFVGPKAENAQALASCNTIFDGGCDRERSGHFIFDKNRELRK